jgi:hypothetical protein
MAMIPCNAWNTPTMIIMMAANRMKPTAVPLGSLPRVDRYCDCSVFCRTSLCGWAGRVNNRSAGPGASLAPPSHQGRAAASLAKDESARVVLASLCSLSARMEEAPARRFIPSSDADGPGDEHS